MWSSVAAVGAALHIAPHGTQLHLQYELLTTSQQEKQVLHRDLHAAQEAFRAVLQAQQATQQAFLQEQERQGAAEVMAVQTAKLAELHKLEAGSALQQAQAEVECLRHELQQVGYSGGGVTGMGQSTPPPALH